MEYLKKRGISDEAIETFKIGFADRTLGLRLPKQNRKEGEEVRKKLKKLGILRTETGHEHFNGCAVFPIINEKGSVGEVYGRRVGPQKSKIYHLYLPGPHVGIFNPACLKNRSIILTESIIDALTFWSNGFKNVTSIYGTSGFTDELFEALIASKTEKVHFAYDNDAAGNRAAERDTSRLQSVGIECFRIKFPHGMDANEYALKVTPASKSLQILINGAAWVGGKTSKTEVASNNSTLNSTLNNLAANVSCSKAEHDEVKLPELTNGGEATNTEELQRRHLNERSENNNNNELFFDKEDNNGIKLPQLAAKQNNNYPLSKAGEDYLLNLGDRNYRIRGLQKNNSSAILKINLRLWHNDLYYLDELNLYNAKNREQFINRSASECRLEPELIKRDIGKLLLQLETLQESRLNELLEPKKPEVVLSDLQRKAAMELLESKNLLERIGNDLALTIVGESRNNLINYLGAVSRKLDKPLGIIIQSSSAAGKTSLMEATLSLMPEEERIKYSAMTGQSLYYLGEKDLKHKILAIVEEEGAEKASYALKLLQSEGELTIASTGKDPETGRMKTEEYHVEGPVMIFLTTTAIEIDEELENRCIMLTVDESREQTAAIHRMQREEETFEGLKRKKKLKEIMEVHQNAQRLLKPVPILNPYAPRLTFLDDRTRTRRDHKKYLTLIRTIALLHQYQRPLKKRDDDQFIEVTLDDIEVANKIAHDILGRSLDELSPQTRRLLSLIKKMIEQKEPSRENTPFTRREVRLFTGWSQTQLKVHLDRLEELEYIIALRGGHRGMLYEYELLFDGDIDSPKLHLCGLIDVEKLRKRAQSDNYDAKLTGVKEEFAGVNGKLTPPKRPQNGGLSGGYPGAQNAPESSGSAAFELKIDPDGAKTHKGAKKRKAS